MERLEGVAPVRKPRRCSPRWMASLLYNSGRRRLESIRLRVKGIDLETGQIMFLEDDRAEGQANIFLPEALKRKYSNAVRGESG